MILAFHASDCGSNSSLATIFNFLLFFVCFCCFHFDLVFSFLSLITSAICQLLHLGIKSQKAVEILYCVQKFSLFMSSHSSCLYNRAIFDPTNEVFMQQKILRGIKYISHNLLFNLHQIAIFFAHNKKLLT